MPEGFTPEEAPTRRGRRDPELAARLEEDDLLADAGQSSDQTFVGLAAGDTIYGKVTFAANTPLGEAWYTFGAQSQVLASETEEDAFNRLSSVITEHTLDLASDFETSLNEQIAAQREQARTRRIPQQ